MGQRRPSVREGRLYPGDKDTTHSRAISLGSVAWYTWLEQHSIFLFESSSAHFTARKEKRSGGWYWYAYRRHHGKLRTAYIGKSEELTLERLTAVANTLVNAECGVRSAECGMRNAECSTETTADVHSAFHTPHSAIGTPLPIPLTPLIGREQDVAAVTMLLQCRASRLVSLIGMGGVGKTRLALQVASDVREHFADGVYFVALAPVRDPHLVLPTIAQVLGLGEELNSTRLDLVKAFLENKHLMLVLDNFEQVMPAAPMLVELLTACPMLKLLVTSREVLHICGEHHFAVAPLAFPDPDNLPLLDELSDYPAIDLFLQRAQAIIPDMATNPATMHAIAQVCARLEGLPLAIELAAARLRLLPPQALATRLSHRLDVLTQGGPDMPERHKTLRATFTWSYDLLTDEEQRLFRRLSIFADSCTLEAAEAVCGIRSGDCRLPSEDNISDIPQSFERTVPFLNVVSSLVDKSLVQTSEQEDGEPQIYLLETVREYAWECLVESGELECLQEAHAAYYLNFAGPCEKPLDTTCTEERSLTPIPISDFRFRISDFARNIPQSAIPTPQSNRPAGLTKREMEALLLVAEGLSNDQIADRLVVSTATIKTYLSAIYNKLGVSSRTAAMRYVIDHQLHRLYIPSKALAYS